MLPSVMNDVRPVYIADLVTGDVFDIELSDPLNTTFLTEHARLDRCSRLLCVGSEPYTSVRKLKCRQLIVIDSSRSASWMGTIFRLFLEAGVGVWLVIPSSSVKCEA